MRVHSAGWLCCAALVAINCSQRTALAAEAPAAKTISPGSKTTLDVQHKEFGKTKDGETVEIYTLTNDHGLSAQVITYGAILSSVRQPDRDGHAAEITLGYDDLAGWTGIHPYFGGTIGRFANRIAKGKFTLDSKQYTVPINNGPNSLHGGVQGFDKRIWQAEPIKQADAVGVKLTYLSKDGEEGFPGNLQVTTTYLLNNKNELSFGYMATTDKATPINLTNHAYWNLSGAGAGKIDQHQLKLQADQFLVLDDVQIPTGEMKSVAGTPLDFTSTHALGERIGKMGVGYDHCYVLRNQTGKLAPAATVYDPKTGRGMDIATTQPGIQLYTGNYLENIKGRGGVFDKHDAFCLETQHYPDAVNQPKFPSTILHPGETYKQITVHTFWAK